MARIRLYIWDDPLASRKAVLAVAVATSPGSARAKLLKAASEPTDREWLDAEIAREPDRVVEFRDAACFGEKP